ncbi:hypothetical protein LBMAG56_06320 [Verrucomicrobiota bacterium]|nr:hypothetical protein LBMAG56_06320 [Verrucomicrobiota bacterium]
MGTPGGARSDETGGRVSLEAGHVAGWDVGLGRCHLAFAGPRTWIDWHASQRRARLGLLASNARSRLPTTTSEHSSLTSSVFGRNLHRRSADWEAAHVPPILAAESFVDTHRFRGTCCPAAGWRAVRDEARTWAPG